MTHRDHDEPTSADDPPATPLSGTLTGVRTGLLAGVVFAGGLLVGATVVGLLSPDPVVQEATGTPADAARGGGTSLPPEDASARFSVSGPCLRSVNAAQDTLLLLDDLGSATAELDAARLDEIVRSLIPLESRLEAGLSACEVATEIDPGSAGESPGPATSAPASSAAATTGGGG